MNERKKEGKKIKRKKKEILKKTKEKKKERQIFIRYDLGRRTGFYRISKNTKWVGKPLHPNMTKKKNSGKKYFDDQPTRSQPTAIGTP